MALYYADPAQSLTTARGNSRELCYLDHDLSDLSEHDLDHIDHDLDHLTDFINHCHFEELQCRTAYCISRLYFLSDVYFTLCFFRYQCNPRGCVSISASISIFYCVLRRFIANVPLRHESRTLFSACTVGLFSQTRLSAEVCCQLLQLLKPGVSEHVGDISAVVYIRLVSPRMFFFFFSVTLDAFLSRPVAPVPLLKKSNYDTLTPIKPNYAD